MPKLVMLMRIPTAIDKYVRMIGWSLPQLECKKLAATNFANSSAPAITITASGAPENNFAKPEIENAAPTSETVPAVSPSRKIYAFAILGIYRHQRLGAKTNLDLGRELIFRQFSLT